MKSTEPIFTMVKRLWVYLRKSLLILGQLMGRKSVISFLSRQRDLRNLNTGLLGLCLLVLLPTVLCVSASLWHERKSAQSARILVPIQTPLLLKQGQKPGNESGGSDAYGLTTRLSEQTLARAYYQQANMLYLGEISGRYRVYIDGELMTWGASENSVRPVTVSIPMKRLLEGQPLDLTIEVSEVSHAIERKGKVGEGFVTPEIAEKLIRARLWETELEPLICATAFGLLGVFFLLSWVTHRRRQEYAYFAAFALLQTLMHVCEIDFVKPLLGESLEIKSRLIFLLWEGSLAMLLGFAFARTRASWMITAISLALILSIAPFVGEWFSLSIGSLASWQKYLFKGFVPFAYARGAIPCLIQWNVLSQRKTLVAIGPGMEPRIDRRRRDLRRMGLGLLSVGALYAFQAVFYASTDGAMSLFRLSHFLIILACYGLGIIQDRLQDRLSEGRLTFRSRPGAEKRGDQVSPLRKVS